MNSVVAALLLLISSPADSHTYSGDGDYSVTEYKGLWGAYTYVLKLPEFSLGVESSRTFRIKGYCSTNNGFQISLAMSSPEAERWWENSTIVVLRLIDSKNHVIAFRNGPMNGYNSKASKSVCPIITFQACPPDEGQWTADYVVRGRYGNGSSIMEFGDGVPTHSFSQEIVSDKSLGCGDYRLLLEIKSPHFGNSTRAHLEIVSGWQ